MGSFTIIEKYRGTSYVSEHLYGSWWFAALWALLTAFAIAYFLRRRVRRLFVVLLHLSFVIILIGALLTHLTATKGVVQLRQGQAVNRYLVLDGNDMKEVALPFSITLDSFVVKYHDGTAAPADYESYLTLNDESRALSEDSEKEKSRSTRDAPYTTKGHVSMNNIFTYRGIRFYQSSFSEDMRGSVITLNSDPWGIPVTYVGYALLFVSLIWMLIDPKGQYRSVIRQVLGAGCWIFGVSLFVLYPASAQAANTQHPSPIALPPSAAAKFGTLLINYNDRICPVQTFALDFTKKLYGKRSYKGLSAEQVLTGFVFYGDQWENEPIIKIKVGAMKDRMQLPDHMSMSQFFNEDMGGYILGPYLSEYYRGQQDKFHQDVMKYDDKLMLIMQLRQGKLLKVFPAAVLLPPSSLLPPPSTVWYSPADNLPDDMEAERKEYIQNAFNKLYEYVLAEDWNSVDAMLDKLIAYQQKYGGTSLPTSTQLWAEHTYNAIPFATILFMVNLTMALLCLFFVGGKKFGAGSMKKVDGKRHWSFSLLGGRKGGLVLFLSFLALTFCLALRWIISGTVPMSNGYETMLFMAWVIMLVTLLMCRRFPIMLVFGFLMSGFFLLVSHISQMDPQITHLMPVLSSPLLTIHVSVIMMAFALLSLTFIIGCWELGVRCCSKLFRSSPYGGDVKGASLSQLFLYPAMTCLGLGIFIGAIWANISWGTYWSWDPKETWALITFMVYAVALHNRSFKWLNNPSGYHLFMVLAFLTILMTYFGVNYFLGGMHSYA
jgi:ABC-type transport system involved in cytochrome c biogenesis permease subunit